jgi:thiol:disulfide interchange protein DsbC
MFARHGARARANAPHSRPASARMRQSTEPQRPRAVARNRIPHGSNMKLPLSIALGLFSLAACAQSNSPAVAAAPGAQSKPALSPMSGLASQPPAGTPEARAIDAIRKLNARLAIDHVAPSPLPGLVEVVVGGQVVYISNDGKYMLQGSMLDLAARKDMSDPVLAGVRRELLKRVPESDRIVFAAPAAKHTVVVFTDVECGFCRKFHSQIADYNKAGITVEYLAFPRAGIGSPDYDKMVSVWCAPDRRRALTDAKSDHPVPTRRCANPVADEYNLGQRAGLEGTPMILAEDGSLLGGYVSPAELRAALDQLDAGKAPVASTATGGT